jgi:hypothetical protein
MTPFVDQLGHKRGRRNLLVTESDGGFLDARDLEDVLDESK